MAHKRWVLKSDEGVHTVELEHGYFSGKRIIRVDGRIIDQSEKWFDTGSIHPFQIGNHYCEVLIQVRLGIYFRYGLIVDGRAIPPS